MGTKNTNMSTMTLFRIYVSYKTASLLAPKMDLNFPDIDIKMGPICRKYFRFLTLTEALACHNLLVNGRLRLVSFVLSNGLSFYSALSRD